MNKLTIAATQYGLTNLQSEEQFWQGLNRKISEAAEQGASLLIFPEYMTAHLLTLEPAMTHEAACARLNEYTTKYEQFFTQRSKESNITILAGTHICREANGFVNKAFLFFPDGRVETQCKLHLTPEEQNQWPLVHGDELNVFDTQWGKVSILTCYDMEFPELARAAALQGAELLLCPSYTETAYGYYRVRYCCQARAVENQLFVALSGLVGVLEEERPQVDRGYCQAGLFTPCDFPFTPDGILQIGEVNEDMIVYVEADFSKLQDNREQGAVAPFYDRRPSLYEQEFNKTRT